MPTENPRIGKLPFFAENSFALFIALRYVSVGRRSQLVSFMSLLSISGLALGISILRTRQFWPLLPLSRRPACSPCPAMPRG